MFFIKTLGKDKRKKNLGYGEIQIGEFKETFVISLDDYSFKEYIYQWKESLEKIIRDGKKVALMTWMHPRDKIVNRKAWVLYRKGSNIFIQEHLYHTEITDIEFDKLGVPINIYERKTIDEDGEKISEWKTSIKEIKNFLKLNPFSAT